MRRASNPSRWFLILLLALAAPALTQGISAQQGSPSQPQQSTAQTGPAKAPPATPPPAQPPDDSRYKFSVETRLVVLHATVLDKDKHLVTDLAREHFKVYEDNVEQTIKNFRREDIPVSVGILVDNSGSMRDKRAKVNAAALAFVRTSNPRDEIFIVNFNDEAFLDQDFTSNLEALNEGLEKIDSRGGTAYYDAIQMSVDHLKEGGRKSKKVLVVVTDGEDNASRMNLEQLIKHAQQSETVIYTVGLLGDENHRTAKRARKAMEAISEATGGAAYFPRELNEVEGLAARIAHDIRNQYLLTYTPSSAAQNGTYHSVAVKASAPGRGKLFVRTRTGYYAGPGPTSASARPSEE